MITGVNMLQESTEMSHQPVPPHTRPTGVFPKNNQQQDQKKQTPKQAMRLFLGM
jgi:hypothetical protein